MRTGAVSILVIAFAATSAFGGMVDFGPAADINPGDDAVFQVSVASTVGGPFEAVFAILGTLDPSLTLSFAYDPGFESTATQTPPMPMAYGIYAGGSGVDLGVGGNNTLAPGWSAPLTLGTLTVGTAGAGLVAGDTREIFADFDKEVQYGGLGLSTVLPFGGQAYVDDEALVGGIGIINVVPEPATLALLALGGIAVLRRRTTA
ncbi:MAG: PEP-CTERM sorting domain-containing protein [Phycisphaerae bacterium]